MDKQSPKRECEGAVMAISEKAQTINLFKLFVFKLNLLIVIQYFWSLSASQRISCVLTFKIRASCI